MRRFLLILAVAVIAGTGYIVFSEVAHAPAANESARRVAITGGTETVSAEIVDTVASRAQGLSGRASLGESEGMLFVFPVDDVHGFWMKDMNFAIDMIWIDAGKKVVHIAANATPESYPASFVPASAARYVLEVPAGWAARNNVSVGSTLGW